MPIYSILNPATDPLNAFSERFFVDRTCRVYLSWTQWMKKNTLPMLKYAIPASGFYTTSPYSRNYDFDIDGNLHLIYGNSPSCSVSSKIFGGLDCTTAIGGLGNFEFFVRYVQDFKNNLLFDLS